MRKSTFTRTVGFVGALGVSASLVGYAATSTGAYFTDSKSGTISAATGQVKINTTNTALNFADLLPAEYKTRTIEYTAQGSDTEDIWLVFPSDGAADAFVGTAGTPSGAAALGRFGHLKITSTGGANFVSNNLANKGTGIHDGNVCSVNGNGWGGTTLEPTTPTDTTTVPFCAPGNAILLESGMTAGQSGAVDIEFGFTKLLKSPQAQAGPMTQVAAFKVVATQHNVRPDNIFN